MEENNYKRRNINPATIREPETNFPREEKQKKKNNSFDEKNYLNMKLMPNQDEKSLRIRLLPIDPDTGELFKEIESHSLTLSKKMQKAMNLDTPYKSYHCLKKTTGLSEEFGHKCPFCERNWEMYQKSLEQGLTEEEKKHYQQESFNCMSHKAVILRCIERGKEEDGPKFMKVKLRSDKMDIFHSLMKIYNERKAESEEEAKDMNGGVLPEGFVPYNVFDLYDGKDIKMTITRMYDKNGKDLGRTSVAVMDYGNRKPLVMKNNEIDYNQINEWLDNPKKWCDVFVAKPYDYLKVLLEEKYPFFSKEEDKWIGLEVQEDGRFILPWKDGRSDAEIREARDAEMDEQIENARRNGLEDKDEQPLVEF